MTKKIVKPEILLSKKEDKKIHLEFISSKKTLTDLNFTINWNGIKRKISNGAEYNKLRFKMIFIHLKLIYYKSKIYFLKKWISYSKFCYFINLIKKEVEDV
jgi:hypothetical protein